MTDDQDPREPIRPPTKDHPEDKVRALIEAGVEAIPLGGTITRLAEELIPTQAQKGRETWEGAISARTNENTDRLDRHDGLLSPKTSLTGVTAQLVAALARTPGDGMRGPSRTLDDLCALLPAASRQAVEDAAFELQSYDLVKITRTIGKHWWLRINQEFYEQFDCQLMEWGSTTEADARTLARLILEDEARARTAMLHEASGWEKRRFNPAFAFLLQFIDERRISREIQPHYPSSSVTLLPEDRAVLRRFVAAGSAT